jgi:hypothetical protein
VAAEQIAADDPVRDALGRLLLISGLRNDQSAAERTASPKPVTKARSRRPVAAAVGHWIVPEKVCQSEAGASCSSIVQGGRKRRGDGMGESRDAVKAASEIGVIMMGRSVQNKPSTFR